MLFKCPLSFSRSAYLHDDCPPPYPSSFRCTNSVKGFGSVPVFVSEIRFKKRSSSKFQVNQILEDTMMIILSNGVRVTRTFQLGKKQNKKEPLLFQLFLLVMGKEAERVTRKMVQSGERGAR